MKQAFRDLIEFQRQCGQATPEGGPRAPDQKTTDLRLALVEEESRELLDAIWKDDLAEIADGIADLVYVALGTAVQYGIDIVPIWEAVHRANMAKTGAGSSRDPITGKLRKPDSWRHPDVAGILANQKPLGEIYPAEPAKTS